MLEDNKTSYRSTELNAHWHYPTDIVVGAGRIKELGEACYALGMTSPLLITDPGLAALPIVKNTLDICNHAGLRCELFSAIKSNPTGSNVEDGVAVYKSGKHDGVIAFGGGSALDVSKAVALMVGQELPLWDFEDKGRNWKRANTSTIASLIAVPTTAGTGSEVGRACLITDDIHKVKKIIFHPRLLPQHVILDPELTVGLPCALTAATGMDALSHNLEAYCAPFYHPMAEGIAIEGIRLIKEFLPCAYSNGEDLLARTQMLVASSMGATSFQRGLGGMHALAHTLGALYDTHHGLLNAVLMPYVVKANRSAIEKRISRLAHYLNLAGGNFDAFLNWILALRSELGIAHCLHDVGIDKKTVDRQQMDLIGQMAVADSCAGGNPIAFNAQQYSEIFRHALTGEL